MDTIAAFYAAYNEGDADAVLGLYAPDGRHVEVAQGRIAQGRDEIGAGLRSFLESFPDARWKPDRTIVAGHQGAVTYRLTGTLQQQLGPFEPAGQALDLRGVHVFSLGDGGIETTEDYWDSGTFGRQMRA